MEFLLSSSRLLNAAGAFLFFGVGLAILFVGRSSRRGQLVGAFATLFGLAFVVENLVDYEADNISAAIVGSVALLAILACLVLARDLTRTASAPWQRRVWVAGAVLGLAMVLLDTGIVLAGHSPFGVRIIGDGLPGLAAGIVELLQAALLFLVFAISVAYRAHPEAKGLPVLAASIGLFAVFINTMNSLVYFPGSTLAEVVYDVGTMVRGVSVVATCFVWFTLPTGTGRNRGIGLLLLASALAGCAMLLQEILTGENDYGVFGILRTIGVVFLVVAVIKDNVLGIPLPRLVIKRGVLAGGALAILFIVAQVAQNFFSTQYGLLGGGVIAGTFLFAASPVQRAMENRTGGKATVVKPVADGREKSYRNALRFALRDRTVTLDEEAQLFKLAEDLGIGAGRAFDLRHEVQVEGKRGVR